MFNTDKNIFLNDDEDDIFIDEVTERETKGEKESMFKRIKNYFTNKKESRKLKDKEITELSRRESKKSLWTRVKDWFKIPVIEDEELISDDELDLQEEQKDENILENEVVKENVESDKSDDKEEQIEESNEISNIIPEINESDISDAIKFDTNYTFNDEEDYMEEDSKKEDKKDSVKENNNEQYSINERYSMLGYEIQMRKEKLAKYYEENEDKIKNDEGKKRDKYLTKLNKIKELEDEYSILGVKIKAKNKFDEKKMSETFDKHYENRDNLMYERLDSIDDLSNKLLYQKEKAQNYYEDKINDKENVSMKTYEKYHNKLMKIKETETQLEILNTKYNAVRKEKEEEYSKLFS